MAGALGWPAVGALGLWAALYAAFVGIGGRKLLSGRPPWPAVVPFGR